MLANARGSLRRGAPVVIVVNDRRDLYPEILERAGLRLEERYRRHVNRRTGRRSGEFFEDVLVAACSSSTFASDRSQTRAWLLSSVAMCSHALSRTRSSGLDARRVEVEAHLQLGVPAFTIVGLADRACQEAKERVRSGIASAELEWPLRRITVNLAPAELRKEGSGFDLPIALAVLAASRQVPPESLGGVRVGRRAGARRAAAAGRRRARRRRRAPGAPG